MNYIDILKDLISNFGFPICMVIYFIWDKYKVTSNLVQAINNNNRILSMLLGKLNIIDEEGENYE